jgi:hypothetical protein
LFVLFEAGEQQRTSVDLSEIVSADIMAPILSNKQVQEKLIKYLPEGMITFRKKILNY